MRSFNRYWVLAIAVVAAIFLGDAASLQAHEIGTTLVSAKFRSSGSYQIEITTDAVALVEKLGTLAGEAGPVTGIPEALQALLERHDGVFRRRITAAFDGVNVQPAIEYFVSPSTDKSVPPRALIKLAGEIPDDARYFTWTYSWTFATYALMVRHADAAEQATEWLDGGQASSPVDLAVATEPSGWFHTAGTYLVLGFTHIVPKGLDHMLFVLGIFLLSPRTKQVLLQVSAFTIAHSITLALSVYGIVSISPAIVEPLIAVSIVYVAIENLVLSELRPWRVALVFAFGLLHGMGFAGALKDLGLPGSEFVTALITFNAGVEAGQLAVIASAFLLVGWFSSRTWYRRRIVLPASVLIACTAIYWTVERLKG